MADSKMVVGAALLLKTLTFRSFQMVSHKHYEGFYGLTAWVGHTSHHGPPRLEREVHHPLIVFMDEIPIQVFIIS
jgi:hypothetical protein